MNQKGNIVIVVLVGLILTGGLLGGIFILFLQNQPSNTDRVITSDPITDPKPSSYPSITQLPSPTQPSVKPTPDQPKPVATTNQYCPHAFPGIDTDKSISALILSNNLVSAEAALQTFADQYGQKVLLRFFEPSNYAKLYASWENLAEDDLPTLKSYGQLYICEWSKYPPEWVRLSKVSSVAIIKQLVVSDQARAAMPDSVGQTLFLDIDYASSGNSYQQHVIHHEFYHLIEYANYGDMFYKDPSWLAMNHSEFTYGNGGSTAYNNSSFTNIKHPQAGFVSTYATLGIEEDKAETYAYLFNQENHSLLQSWITSDPKLLNKVNFLKKFVQDRTQSMDANYFQRINQ